MKKKTIAVLLLCALFVVMTCGASAPSGTKTKVDYETALGVMGDDGYTNEYFGVGMELPEGWTFFSDEELAQMLDVTLKVIDDEKLTEMMTAALEDAGAVTNMAAKDKLGMKNVNMRLTKVEDKILLALSEEDILRYSIDTVKDMLESAGYEDLELEIGETEFAGENKSILYITGKLYDLPVYQGEVLLMGEEYYAILTFTSVMDDALDEVIEPWYTLEAEED